MKKKHKFLKGMIIYVVLLAVAITGLLIWFWNFIDAYEKAMPYNFMKKEFATFGENTIEEYFDFDAVDYNRAFVTREELVEYVCGLISDDMTYIEAKENTDKNPVYEIKSGDITIAKAYFEEDGEDGYGFTQWKLKEYDVTLAVPEMNSVEIKALADSKVVVDGVTLDESYIIEKDIPAENHQKLSKYLEKAPTYMVYKVDKIWGEHQVSSTDVNGIESTYVMNEDVYQFGWNNNDTLQGEVQSHVETVNELYAKFFTNAGWKLYNYVLDGSYMEENLRLSTTYFYPDEYVTGRKMVSREFSEFRQYSEDCFSCRVNYTYEVYFENYKTDKEVTKNDMTMIFLKSGGKWMLADFVYH